MLTEYLKRFIRNPLKYLKNPKETFYAACSIVKGSRKYQEYLYKEHKRVYGFRNRDKVFYVICPSASTQGLFSIHNYVLWKIRYAIDKGYIPVVDYQNYANMYLEPELVGKVNAWEYYFNQPTQYGLEDVRHSRHVIICDKYEPAGYRGINDDKEVRCFHGIINAYCTLNYRLSDRVEKAKGEYLGGVLKHWEFWVEGRTIQA
ncbi:MAG: hypothetical protein NC337_02865 [Roseburia sp.]|nr:hypothetical protein [Roseburia sp.]MCM1235031.1 hypothetical protein [Ruminococcus flavefaciens]